MKYSVGRYVFGLATIGSGISALASHNYDQLAGVPHFGFKVYIIATIEILAGLAVLWPRTARAGAVALGAIYFIFSLLAIPLIVQGPRVYNNYGNFFEQFSYVAGALILYACCDATATDLARRLGQIGYYGFGLCLVSFTLEQIFYPDGTITLVPKWLPPGGYFWFVATTIAFALAAIAVLTGLMAVLAARLTAAMLLGFELLVWLPALLRDPRSFGVWGEALETLAIAGSALMVAEYLARRSADSAIAR